MNSEQLQSVYKKLGWARGHFDAVDGEILAWHNTNPYRLVYERNHQLTKHWLTLRFTGEKPNFERWSLMVGDAVTNLRDSLDHLIYTIAYLPGSPEVEKRERAAFVIRSRSEDFKKDARTRLCSVPDSVRNAVERFQPYKRVISDLPSPLGVLSELANGNKHKMLSLMFTSPEMLDVEFIGQKNSVAQEATFDLCKADLKDGSPVIIFTVPVPDASIQLNPKSVVGLGIAIRHKAREGNTAFDADRTSYRALLNAIFGEVEMVIETITKLV